MKLANVAIVGATGMVGHTFLKVLEERDFPIGSLTLIASENSLGKELAFKGKMYPVEMLNEITFNNRNFDIALFSAGEGVSYDYARIAQGKGIIVIDNSATWRMYPDVPLVIPEVNKETLANHQGLISNPNCVTIQSLLPLSVIHKNYGIKRVTYNTYQAVSGSGYKGVNDLMNGIDDIPPQYYPKPIAFNCIPQVDEFLDNGYTIEELKMINETKKILNDPSILVTASCVRIPVKNGHSIAINVECINSFELDTLKEELRNKEGIVVHDFPDYPTAIEVSGQDLVHVGRIRRDFTVSNGLHLWVCADNVRKGAATNAIQIAEILWKEKQI
jgi:aspartate-semialdehyde dehydrogenase